MTGNTPRETTISWSRMSGMSILQTWTNHYETHLWYAPKMSQNMCTSSTKPWFLFFLQKKHIRSELLLMIVRYPLFRHFERYRDYLLKLVCGLISSFSDIPWQNHVVQVGVLQRPCEVWRILDPGTPVGVRSGPWTQKPKNLQVAKPKNELKPLGRPLANLVR